MLYTWFSTKVVQTILWMGAVIEKFFPTSKAETDILSGEVDQLTIDVQQLSTANEQQNAIIAKLLDKVNSLTPVSSSIHRSM